MERGVFVALVLSALIAFTTGSRRNKFHRTECLCDKNKHEVFTDCLSNCAVGTCANQGEIFNCPLQFASDCKPGCICAENYVRQDNSAGSPCVPISSCPSDEPTDFNCGPNTVPIPSGGCVDFCPPTCRQPIRGPCPRICLPEGCNCKEGYIRAEFKNSSCIPVSECPCAE